MKRFYLLFLALIACVGATWATPITALDGNVVGKVFTIRSGARGAFVYSEAYGAEYVSGSARSGYGALDNTDPNFLFAFVQSGDNYFLYSIGAAKYCVYAEDGVKVQDDAPEAGVALLESTGGAKDQFPTVIAIDGSHQLNMSADQGKGILTDWNDTGDAGNMLAIEEVDGCAFDNDTKEFTDNRITITYKYTYGGKVIATQQYGGMVGNAYPTPAVDVFGLECDAPEGTIKEEDAETPVEVVCRVSENFPFKYFSSFDEIDTWYAAKLHSNQTHWMNWTGEAIAFADERPDKDDAYGWGFVGNPVDGFKVYNKMAGSALMLDDAVPCSMSAEEKIVKTYASSAKTMLEGGFAMKFDGQDFLNYQGGAVKRWSSNDAGSTWLLEEIDFSVDAAAKQAKADALALISASSILFGDPAVAGTLANTAREAIEAYTYDSNSEDAVASAIEFYNNTVSTMCAAVDKDIVFFNTNRSDKYMVVTDAVQLSGADAADGTSIFRVKGVEGTTGFTIRNKANERYIADAPAASNRIQLSTTAGEFTIKSFGTDNKFAFISANPADARHNSLHLDGSFRVVAWEADNEGNASVWMVQEPAAELSVQEGAMIVKNQVWGPVAEVMARLGAAQIGDGLGQYNGDEAAVAEFQRVQNALSVSIDELDFETVYALSAEADNLQPAFDALSINQPGGKAFTIRGKQNGQYLSSAATELDPANPEDVDANRVKMVGEENADIYLLTADNRLVSYTAGLGFTNSEKVAVPGIDINTMSFEKGTNAGCYVLRSDYEGNPYLYNSDESDVLCSNAATAAANTDWTLAEVAALPIKMVQEGKLWYATFNAPVAVAIPVGLKAYGAAPAQSGDALDLSLVVTDGVLAANTPVILCSEEEFTSLAISTEMGTSLTTNTLSGTNQTITVAAGENYVLGNEEGIGFYKHNDTTMPAFQAYLPLTSEASVLKLYINGVETAIKAVEGDNGKAVIYDIAGRRVQQAAKGLYIVNGKKVMCN